MSVCPTCKQDMPEHKCPCGVENHSATYPTWADVAWGWETKYNALLLTLAKEREEFKGMETKYEGYLQSIRDDWKADSAERDAYIEKLEKDRDAKAALVEELVEKISLYRHVSTHPGVPEENWISICESLDEALKNAREAR